MTYIALIYKSRLIKSKVVQTCAIHDVWTAKSSPGTQNDIFAQNLATSLSLLPPILLDDGEGKIM